MLFSFLTVQYRWSGKQVVSFYSALQGFWLEDDVVLSPDCAVSLVRRWGCFVLLCSTGLLTWWWYWFVSWLCSIDGQRMMFFVSWLYSTVSQRMMLFCLLTVKYVSFSRGECHFVLCLYSIVGYSIRCRIFRGQGRPHIKSRASRMGKCERRVTNKIRTLLCSVGHHDDGAVVLY